MKAQIKAIVASAVVIALCLAAVGGVTYSWFSDSEESDVNVSTAIVDMEIEFGTPSDNSPITDIVDEGNNIFTLQNLAASFSGTVPVESKTNLSTINTVFRQSVTITIPSSSELTGNKTLLTEYDAKNITVCGKTLYDIIKGTNAAFDVEAGESYTYDFPWQSVASLGAFSLEPLTFSTPQTYGDKVTGGYLLPDGTTYTGAWSQTTHKPFSVTVNYQMYQGDYPYAEFGTGATIQNDGAVIGTIDYTDASSTTTSVPLAVNFTAGNGYTTSPGSSPETVTNKIVSATMTNVDTDTVKLNLGLKDGDTPINNPTFTTPVVITITVPGDLTDNGQTTPSVVFNGNDEQPSIISYERLGNASTGYETTITFSVTHFSEYVIGKETKITSGQNQIEKSGKFYLNEDITGSISIGNDITVILDLNGHTINGTITVDGSGKYLTINDSVGTGKIIASGGAVRIYNDAEVTINGGTFESTSGNGIYVGAFGNGNVTNGGKLTFNNGAVYSQEFSIWVIHGGDATINGGYFFAKDNANVASNGSSGCGPVNVTINGGNFIGNITDTSIRNGYGAFNVFVSQSGNWNINGGKYTVNSNGGGVPFVVRSGNVNININNIEVNMNISDWNATMQFGDASFICPSATIGAYYTDNGSYGFSSANNNTSLTITYNNNTITPAISEYTSPNSQTIRPVYSLDTIHVVSEE